MAPRSTSHRPVDKISQLLIDDHNTSDPYTSAYQTSFQPADTEVYRSGGACSTTSSCYTVVKGIIEQEDAPKPSGQVSSRRVRKTGNIGQQRDLGTVESVNKTKQLTHGIVTPSGLDMRKLLFPGCKNEPEKKQNEETKLLEGKTHGSKSNSDPTGGNTLKALRYQPCNSEVFTSDIIVCERSSISPLCLKRTEGTTKKISDLITNQNQNGQYRNVQDAIKYLGYLRTALVGSCVDLCKKDQTDHADTEAAVGFLSTISNIPIQFSKLLPLFQIINIATNDKETMCRFWDLFDKNVPLSEFKFGRYIRQYDEHDEIEEFPTSEAKCFVDQDQAEIRLKAMKFRNFDTAADLISPKPGTVYGLGHVDYFLPRNKEEIKTIFRNFDLSEEEFEDSWKCARKLESCDMNKVSAENFKKILHDKDVKLFA